MNLKFVLLLIFVMLAASTFALRFTPDARTPDVSHDAPCQSAVKEILTGRVEVKSYFGPPNFGEEPKTDSKEIVPVLILDTPTEVCSDTTLSGTADTEVTVSELQMLIMFEHKENIGKMVRATGKIFKAHTGHHHTDYLINVESITNLEETSSERSNAKQK